MMCSRAHHPRGRRGSVQSPDAGEDALIRWLLILPFIGLMIVPFYNVKEPFLFGFPFFYWYQLAWIPGGMLVTWLVWRSERP